MAIIRDGDEDWEALISISHDEEYATATCVASYGSHSQRALLLAK